MLYFAEFLHTRVFRNIVDFLYNFTLLKRMVTGLYVIAFRFHLTNIVVTLAPSFFILSFSFLKVRRITIKSCMSSKLGRIRPRTVKLG